MVGKVIFFEREDTVRRTIVPTKLPLQVWKVTLVLGNGHGCVPS